MSHSGQETHAKDNDQGLLTGREGNTIAYRRRAASPNTTNRGRFELLPTTTVYETPWDQQLTPDVNTLSFSTASRHYEGGYDSSAARPLLGDEGARSSTNLLDSKTTPFATAFGKRRDSDNDVFEQFGPVPNSANSQGDFNLPQKESPRVEKPWIPAKHPFWPDTFEPIHWPPLIFLTIVVIFTYPFLFLAAFIARGRTLFWTRFIVGGAASLLGFTLGLGLMRVGQRTLEAATWATFIHRSLDGRGGLTLGDLDAKSTYPNFTSLGFSLFLERNMSRIFWRGRRVYDKKPWSFFILMFTFMSILAASTSFLLGRLVDISTENWQQGNFYKEVAVTGDLSPEDVVNFQAQLAATQSYISTWSLTSFGTGGQLPVQLPYQGNDVYFTEIADQLLSGGLGVGTARQNYVSGDASRNITSSRTTSTNEVPVGSTVRYSRWGIRSQCTKLPDPSRNLLPLSPNNMTYAYVPRDTVFSLMDGLGLQDVPFAWNRTYLHPNDTVPQGVDQPTIGLVGVWSNNGVASSFFTYTIGEGQDGKGWVVLDVIMMRLNISYTPHGSFPVYSTDGTIGYDAAICVKTIEPWVVDTYNSTAGRVQTLKIVGKGGLSTLDYNFGKNIGDKLDGLDSTLTSAGKYTAYAVAHDNSRNQILKDNGRDFWWVPNPTAVSWTDGSGPEGYTSLSAEHLQDSLAKADAAQFLPYLTGSQPLLAYQYTEQALAYATVLPVPTALTLLSILILGYVSAFFVPRLPLGVPRRDFSLFTWIAAFEGDGILHTAIKHDSLRHNMNLEELQQEIGDRKVRYNA